MSESRDRFPQRRSLAATLLQKPPFMQLRPGSPVGTTSETMIWTQKSDPQAFAERRTRLQGLLSGPALFPAGFSRPRNFQHNRFPFRAESHFLYLIGRSIEEAALLITPSTCTLFAPPADPEAELWTGPMQSLD